MITYNGKTYENLAALVSEDLTPDVIQMVKEGQQALNGLAHDYFWKRFKADPEWDGNLDPEYDEYSSKPSWTYPSDMDVDSLHIGADVVSVRCSAPICGRGCCGHDSHTYEFPTAYLWQDQSEILADLKTLKEAKEKARKEAKRKEEEAEAKAQEDRERQQLTRLQAKYGES